MDDTLNLLLAHWPFILFSAVCFGITQALKGILWTKKRVETGSKSSIVIWWGRKLLPFQPVLLGIIVGLIPGIPASEGVATIAAKALYFAGSGVLSTWIFDVAKCFAKQRGLDLKLSSDYSAQPTPAETVEGRDDDAAKIA